jgi:16S rRNA (uracil1498-N3)-methyltransferase
MAPPPSGANNGATRGGTAFVMPSYDFHAARLFIDGPLAAGGVVALDRAQAHYLKRVLRLKDGQDILVFNGRDGEWRGMLEGGRREATLRIGERRRAQTAPADLHYLFALLKSARLDYMVQKAVEMGVSQLRPVLTRHGQIARVNLERMRANAIEAAEQCGILCLPQISAPLPLTQALAALEPERHLVFCDEAADVADPLAALAAVPRRAPLAVLIGPEGGFAADERAALLKLPHVVRLALGPRILRADTAAVAALALIQAVIGDWR